MTITEAKLKAVLGQGSVLGLDGLAALLSANFAPGSSSDQIEDAVALEGSFVANQGLRVDLPAMTLSGPSGTFSIPAQIVNITAPAAVSVVAEVLSLTFGTASIAGGLVYQWPANIVITRDSDSAKLVKGVDWDIREATGQIFGILNVAPQACHVTYTGNKHRYDSIWVDAVTHAVGVTAGTDAIVDPENYGPTVPAGKIEVFRVYVTRFGTELINTAKFQGYAPRAQAGAYARHQQWCRERLPKTLKKLSAAGAIKLGGYGDSTTSLSLHLFPAPDQLVHNGLRDSANYFTRLSIETFVTNSDSYYNRALYGINHEDAAAPGQNALNDGQFHRIGWNWVVRQRLLDLGASAVTYYNMGVGGADTTTSASPVYNGGNATRLAAINGLALDLIVVNFGTNNPTNANFEAEYEAIVTSLTSTGAEVIISGPPQTCSGGGWMTDADWNRMNAAICRIGRKKNVAFVNQFMTFGNDSLGGIKQSRQNMSGANLANHPLDAQLLTMGAVFADLIG